jgi:serine/threonine-protein kinase HipA
MSLNGKRDGFTRDDLLELANFADIKKRPAGEMIDRIVESVSRWPEFADQAGVEPEWVARIAQAHRLVREFRPKVEP